MESAIANMAMTGITHFELDSGSSESISDVWVAVNYFIHSLALYAKGMFKLEPNIHG